MINWKTVKIGDIASRITSGGTPSTSRADFYGGNIPWLKTQEVDFGRIYQTDTFITEEGLKNSSAKWIDADSVIVAMYGNTAAKVAITKIPLTTNQACCNITVDKEKADYRYLYYWLFKEYINLKSLANGGAQQNLNANIIRNYEISIPDLITQQKIAEILSALDDKIELNRRMNRTLEKMAQTLFRQYFVDGIDADNLPEGWREGKLDEIVNVKGGTTPSTKQREFWDGDLHWTSPKDLSNLRVPVLLDTEKKITPAGLKKISSGLLPVGTLLLSSRAPIGYLALTQIPVAINQGYIAILGDKGYSNYFLLNWIKENMHIIIQNANGSTFLEISKSAFKNIDLAIPPVKTVSEFDEKVESLYQKMVLNEKEIAKLTIIRDTLLPKLMSGEIDVMQTQTAGQYEEVLS